MKNQVWYGLPSISALLACAVLMVPACSRLGPCVAGPTHPQLWMSAATTTPLFLAAAMLLGWTARFLYLVVKTAYLLRPLLLEPWPAGLRAAVDRTGASRVTCVSGDTPLAFCAGILWPRIYVTRRLVAHLRPEELDAVLLHEDHHSSRRDPLLYAARQALADVCFCLPLLRWWMLRRREDAELGADRAAIKVVGHRPVAGALWALGTAAQPFGTAAFHGSPGLRAAHILGDPLPRRRPSHADWLRSAVGLLSVISIAGCVSELLIPH